MSEAEEIDDVEGDDVEGYDFEEGLQRKIVALMLRDTAFLTRCSGLVEPDFLTLEVDGHLVQLALDYYAIYRKAPDRGVMRTLLGDYFKRRRLSDKALVAEIVERIKELLKEDITDVGLVTEKVVAFARDRAMGLAILSAVDDKEKGDFEAIRKRVQSALLVGVDDSETDYNYFDMIAARSEERKSRIAGLIKKDGITTGYDEIDRELHHGGWGRKELSLMMGPAKAGKSMSLGDFGKNAAVAGFNVTYLSCEVSAKIIAERLDANIAGVMMKKLDDSVHAIEEAVRRFESKSGALHLKEYASGTLRPSDIRRLLERQRAMGLITDLLIVDYADIMAPERRVDNPIENSRSIYVDLRAIAFDYDVACLTATQTNREGAKKMTATATDVAEDYNRIRTADVVISINATEAEKSAGEARLFFAASRNTESEFTLRIKQDRAKMRFIEKILGRE